MKYSVYCPTHDSEILMTRRDALSFWKGPDGPVIRWKCECGHEGFLDPHGSHPVPQGKDDTTEMLDENDQRLVA